MIELYRKVRFSHPDYTYTGTTYTEYLFGSIGLKVTAEIMIQVNWGTEDVNLKYTTAGGSIERLDGGISNFQADGWQVGDTYVTSGTALNAGTGTINSFSDDYTIMYVSQVLVDETVVSTLQGDKAITSIDFYPNLVPNNDGGFERSIIGLGQVGRSAIGLGGVVNSLVDSETVPKYYADTISTDSANPTIMTIGTNSKGWVTPADSATIYSSNLGTSTNQIFVISHTFNITPIFLANQLANLKKGIPPAAGSYKDRDCLKYVFSVDGKFTALDPTITHTTDGNVEFPKGQTGWFNEFINGRPTVWTKESIAYTDSATGAALSAIDYCKVVNGTAVLQCQVTPGITYIVQVMYLPQNEEEYVNTATDFKTNFIYERAVVTVGTTAQGENTGDYHFLKDVIATALASNRIQITFQIDFSQALIDIFDCKDSDNLNYLVFITAQNGTAAIP